MLIIKLLIRINTYNLPYSKNAKRKSGYIKNKNNEVLGKGERERENRFYKIGFPLAVKINAQKARGGEEILRKSVSLSQIKKQVMKKPRLG